MKAVIQRVYNAELSVGGEAVSRIDKGLVVFFVLNGATVKGNAKFLPTSLQSCVFSKTETAK